MDQCFMVCYVFYFEMRRAMSYGRISKMFLIYDICNQVMLSQNHKCRLGCVYLLL